MVVVDSQLMINKFAVQISQLTLYKYLFYESPAILNVNSWPITWLLEDFPWAFFMRKSISMTFLQICWFQWTIHNIYTVSKREFPYGPNFIHHHSLLHCLWGRFLSKLQMPYPTEKIVAAILGIFKTLYKEKDVFKIVFFIGNPRCPITFIGVKY